jgi:hypothetical protein
MVVVRVKVRVRASTTTYHLNVNAALANEGRVQSIFEVGCHEDKLSLSSTYPIKGIQKSRKSQGRVSSVLLTICIEKRVDILQNKNGLFE